MKNKLQISIAIVIAACGAGGCTSLNRNACYSDRIESAASRLAGWSEGDACLRSATRRMGILLPHGAGATGFPIKLTAGGSEPRGHFVFINDRTPGDQVKIGAAVPITKDGYFLTASHCLEGAEPAVFLHDRTAKKLIKSPAYIVWKSDVADLALLRTTLQVAHPFTLADAATITEGDTVGSTGWSGLGDGGVFDSMATGNIGSISKHQDYSEILHDAPIQPGDSGGPLIDRQGRLVGIHIGGRNRGIALPVNRERTFRSVSNLPDMERIIIQIKADRLARLGHNKQVDTNLRPAEDSTDSRRSVTMIPSYPRPRSQVGHL